MIKSPISYPGGKSRAVKIINELIPDDVKELVSPFIGGASIELSLSDKDIFVYGYDKFWPLINFWICATIWPVYLSNIVKTNYQNMSKEEFYDIRDGEDIYRRDLSITNAAKFYSMNHHSFGGLTLSGPYAPPRKNGRPRISDKKLDSLSNFNCDNISFQCADFKDSLSNHPDMFAYIDPPYYKPSRMLYGRKGDLHKGFDHEGLADILNDREGGFILSYDNQEYIKSLYEGRGYKFLYPEWTYAYWTPYSSTDSKEMLIIKE